MENNYDRGTTRKPEPGPLYFSLITYSIRDQALTQKLTKSEEMKETK